MSRLTSISKNQASAAVPFAGARAPGPESSEPEKSLTVKLKLSDYWALRDFCTEQERVSGRRVTHQEAMVTALHAMLGRGPAA
jgi:hypothetical protein